MIRVWTLRRFLAIAMVCLGTQWGDAQSNADVSAELQALKKRVDEQQHQIDILSAKPAIPVEKEKPFLDYQLRGRIEADALWATQSPLNKVVLGDIENALGFRRARLGVQGTAGETVNWISEFDFAGGVIRFRDVFVGTNAFPLLRQVQVGHFREPFSLEGQTTSNALTFLERSPGGVLNPARNWGVGFFTWNDAESVTLQGGVFASGTDSNGLNIGDSDDAAFTLRATALPWHDDDGRRLWHIGGAYSFRSFLNDQLVIAQQPQSSLLQPVDNPLTPLVQDLIYRASHDQRLNVQTAMNFGSLSFQAEWSGDWIDQIGGGPVFLHASYAFVSWFPTGEHREYNRTKAAFVPVKVIRPFLKIDSPLSALQNPGAWELAVRFSALDFRNANNPLTAGGLKTGEELGLLTIGVNWYLNDNARVMFNVSPAALLDPNFGRSSADVFGVRTAVFW